MKHVCSSQKVLIYIEFEAGTKAEVNRIHEYNTQVLEDLDLFDELNARLCGRRARQYLILVA